MVKTHHVAAFTSDFYALYGTHPYSSKQPGASSGRGYVQEMTGQLRMASSLYPKRGHVHARAEDYVRGSGTSTLESRGVWCGGRNRLPFLGLKRLDARKGVPLKERKECTTCSRNEAEFVPELHLMYRGVGISTTYDRQSVRVSDRFTHVVRSLGEILVLKGAHRTVPYDRLSGVESLAIEEARCRPDIECHRIGGDLLNGYSSSESFA
ncbi:MAG: hypothetical protein RL518_2706 [Pseudomonadota bacterium]